MDKYQNKNKSKKKVSFLDLYNAFLTYQKILERFDRGSVDDGSYFIGYVLITSLTCEIGIKALLKNEGKDSFREHKLDKLFERLSDHQQKEIANKCHYNIVDELKKDLSINNDHFIAWRYFYEGNCVNFDPFFIKKLIKALNIELSNIANTKQNI